MTVTDLTSDLDRAEIERRTRRKILVGGVAAGVLVTLLPVAAWSTVESHVRVADDYWRGVAAGKHAPDTTSVGGRRAEGQQVSDWCEAVAESTYNHPLFVHTDDDPDDDWAPRSEQMFHQGCIGQPMQTPGD